MSEIVVQIEHANIYQSDSLILQDVNLNVQKGEFVYLVGKTGTGKSSLLKTLYGELTLTEGVGHVVGFNLKEMDWKKLPFLRRNLGVVFQDFQLLSDRNVNENLSFVLKATGWQDEQLIQQKIDDVLNKVGRLSHSFKTNPENGRAPRISPRGPSRDVFSSKTCNEPRRQPTVRVKPGQNQQVPEATVARSGEPAVTLMQ